MDEAMIDQQPADLHPYGLFGLFFSLLGVALIAMLALAASLGLAAVIHAIVFGWPSLRDSFAAIADLAYGGPPEDLLAAGLFLGCAVYLAGVFGLWTVARMRAGKAWPLLLAWTPFTTNRAFWGLLLVAIAYQVAAGLLIGHLYPPAKQWFVLPESPAGLAMGFLLVVALAPLCEELLFRGWIYTALRWRFGFGAALWGTAALFALAHWESTHLYALVIMPIGLALGWLRERTGSAKATMLFHMLYNFSGLALSFLGKP